MRMMSSWDFSTRRTQIVSWRTYGIGWGCLDWNYTQNKTRRIEFGRFAEQNRERRGEGKPETFDFLGFSVPQKAHG
jgi:hypothetical protein